MKRRVLKAFVSTMVAASLLSQTAMAAVVSEEIPGSVWGKLLLRILLDQKKCRQNRYRNSREKLKRFQRLHQRRDRKIFRSQEQMRFQG